MISSRAHLFNNLAGVLTEPADFPSFSCVFTFLNSSIVKSSSLICGSCLMMSGRSISSDAGSRRFWKWSLTPLNAREVTFLGFVLLSLWSTQWRAIPRYSCDFPLSIPCFVVFVARY